MHAYKNKSIRIKELLYYILFNEQIEKENTIILYCLLYFLTDWSKKKKSKVTMNYFYIYGNIIYIYLYL